MLPVALQEWSSVCDLLGSGRLVLAVRKGGIHERHGGLFALEHDRFALLPTRLHQDPSRLRPEFTATAGEHVQPGLHRIALWAEAARIWKVAERGRLDAIAGELAWTAAELDARFAYRGQPFLFVVALRVHRLPAAALVPDHPSYAGCRSWIPLREHLADEDSVPVVAQDAWDRRLAAIAAALEPATQP